MDALQQHWSDSSAEDPFAQDVSSTWLAPTDTCISLPTKSGNHLSRKFAFKGRERMARALGKLQRFLATLLIGHIYRIRLARSAKAE